MADEGPEPSVVVKSADGEPLPPLGAWVQGLRSRLSTCKLAPGTVLQVRLARRSGSTHVDLGPEAVAGDGADACVRAALATIDADGASGRASPSDRPSGFTALLELQW